MLYPVSCSQIPDSELDEGDIDEAVGGKDEGDASVGDDVIVLSVEGNVSDDVNDGVF